MLTSFRNGPKLEISFPASECDDIRTAERTLEKVWPYAACALPRCGVPKKTMDLVLDSSEEESPCVFAVIRAYS